MKLWRWSSSKSYLGLGVLGILLIGVLVYYVKRSDYDYTPQPGTVPSYAGGSQERKALIGRIPSRKDLDDLKQCRENLRILHEAVLRYMKDHQGRPPAFLTVDEAHEPGSYLFDSDAGLYPRYISDPKIFVCPAAERQDILPARQLEQTYYYLFEYPDLRQWHLLDRKIKSMKLRKEDILLIQCIAHPSEPRPAGSSYLAINLAGEILWMDQNNEKRYSKFFQALDWARNAYRSLTSTALAKLGYYSPKWTKPRRGNDLERYRRCNRVLQSLLVEYGIAENEQNPSTISNHHHRR